MDFGASLTLKDNFTATMKKAQKEQSKFKKEVNRLSRKMDRAYEKKRRIRIKNSKAVQAIDKVKRRIKPLRKRVVTALAYKDHISRRVQRVHGKLKILSRSVFKPVIAVKDRATRAIKGIGRKVKNLVANPYTIMVGLASAGAGMGFALKQGSNLEQQKLAMEHFIGVQNQSMNAQEVAQERDEYIKQLRENANLTPFATQDVISAGAKAINAMEGDTEGAMGLVQLAEDMAALNPRKSLKDAILALKQLKVGETERMKEFGFKISAEDIAEASGVADANNMADLNEEQMAKAYSNIVKQKLTPFFEGGARKLSKTGGGLFSTIQGKLGTRIQNVGLEMLNELKPVMKDVIALIDRYADRMDALGKSIGNNLGDAIEFIRDFKGEIITTFSYAKYGLFAVGTAVSNSTEWMIENFDWVGQGADDLKGDMRDAWVLIEDVIGVAWSNAKPALDGIAGGIKIMYEISKMALPYVIDEVEKFWQLTKPVFMTTGSILQWMAGTIDGVAESMGGWKWIKPFLKGLVTTWGALYSTLAIYNGIVKTATALQWAWNVAMSANPIGLVVTGIGLLVGLGYMLVDNWTDVKATFFSIWDGLVNKVKESVANILDSIPDMFLPEGVEQWRDNVLKTVKEADQVRKDRRKNKRAMKDIENSTQARNRRRNNMRLKRRGYSGNSYDTKLNTEGKSKEEISNQIQSMNPIKVDKLADKFEIREEQDIEKVAEAIAEKLKEAQKNGGGI